MLKKFFYTILLSQNRRLGENNLSTYLKTENVTWINLQKYASKKYQNYKNLKVLDKHGPITTVTNILQNAIIDSYFISQSLAENQKLQKLRVIHIRRTIIRAH